MFRLLLAGIVLLVPAHASAQATLFVSNEIDLRGVLMKAAAGDRVVLTADIGLTADLPSINRDLIIDGNGFTLSGNDQYRGFFVARFDTSAVNLAPVSVTIQNLTIADAAAIGGAGGNGAAGGGGGAGLGGALFVADQATVTLSNVNIVSSAAVGGSGGAGNTGLAGGGGGGLGGSGASGAASVSGGGGGGGGVGRAATGGTENASGSPGILQGAGSGGFTDGDGLGGPLAGGGAGGWDVEPDTGGGGGVVNGFGSSGGFGGGGGGAFAFGSGFGDGDSGGFGGGGGGGLDGFGGFGGGGGGSLDVNPNFGGPFAGAGAVDAAGNGGGGGAGLGGAIFVQEGGTIQVAGGLSVNGSAVSGGTGGNGAQNGSAHGAGLFLQGFGTLSFAPGAGQVVTIADAIADQDGSGADPDFPGVWNLVKNGIGRLVLGGDNRYSGDTFVNAGTLAVSSDANLGVGGFLHLADATALEITGTGTFNRSTAIAGAPTFAVAPGRTATWSGAITESLPGSTLTVSGGGTLALTNAANQYTGGTFVIDNSALMVADDAVLGAAGGGIALGTGSTGGTIRIGGGANFVTGRSVVLNAGGGTIDVPASGAGTFTGSISGAGALFKTGAGTLTLGAGNSYAGGTAIHAGMLQAGAANAFGPGAMTIDGGATLNLNGFDQAFGALGGSGAVLITNASLTLGADNSSATFGGSLAGNGSLVKVGDGTLHLAGSASYTGGTAVLNGTLSGSAGNLRGTIDDHSLLVFIQESDATFGGTLNGTGSMHKLGGGTLTLNGVHGLTGTTTVSQGSLLLNGSLAGSVGVAPGATLEALGSIGGSVEVAGGLLVSEPEVEAAAAARPASALAATAPDEPSLTIGGTLLARPGSVIGLTVGEKVVAPLQAGGRVLLDGAVLDVDLRGQPSAARVTSFPAITARDGVAVSDTTVTTREPTIVPVSLRNSPTSVFVTLVNLAPPLAPIATTPNGAAVAAAVDRVKLDATGDLRSVVTELAALDDASLDTALRDIAGEIYGSQLQLALLDADIITDMVREQIADPSRYAGSGERLHWWGQLSGEHATFDGEGLLQDAVANVGGGAGGFDWRPTDRWFFGGGGGYSNGTMRLDGPGGVSTLIAPRAFGYGGFTRGRWGVNFGGSTARVTGNTSREIVFTARIDTGQGEQPLTGGIDRQANSDQLGLVSDAWGEYNDTLTVDNWSFNWNVGMRRMRFGRDGWTESGAGALALTAAEQVLNLTQTDVKLRLWKREGQWRPHFATSFRRELTNGETQTLLRLGGDPDADFTIDGIPVPGNAFMGRGGITARVGFFGEVTVDFEYRHAAGQSRQSVDLRFRFR